MSKSLNKVLLLGNLGKNPVVSTTATGTTMVKFSLATNERFKNKTGEWQGRCEWHNIVMFGSMALAAQKYLKKGSSVFLEGSLRTHSWGDDPQQKRYMTEIIADDFTMLDKRDKAE